MVTLTALATTAPIVVAPAMDSQMWENTAVVANVEALRERGVEVVGPEEGRLASGRRGAGRLAETRAILGAVRAAIGRRHGDLCGRSIIVTAGGTQEPLDPVRYIGNRSSGRMGFSIAAAARDRGARVSLVTGAVAADHALRHRARQREDGRGDAGGAGAAHGALRRAPDGGCARRLPGPFRPPARRSRRPA